jgi:hypothetical protein
VALGNVEGRSGPKQIDRFRRFAALDGEVCAREGKFQVERGASR